MNPSSQPATCPYRIQVSADSTFSSFAVSPISHTFHRHPLMQTAALRQLASRLAKTDQCRFVRPGISQASVFAHAPYSADGRTIEQVFDELSRPGSWVALYNVETDELYRTFLSDVQSAFQHLVEREQGRVHSVGGFIFISAPPAVTPFHIDRESNFWLQIRGRKSMSVWNPGERGVIPDHVVEDFIVTRDLSQVRLNESMRTKRLDFDTGPGDGVYFPSTSPHMTHSGRDWVSDGDDICVSIGVVFYTDVTRRHARVHALNRLLRRCGFSPQPPGANKMKDRVKEMLGSAAVKVQRRLGLYDPPPGM